MASKNLSGLEYINIDLYADRIGENLFFSIHDTGCATAGYTPNVLTASAWGSYAWDISGIADGDKDAIDLFSIKVVDASAANTFYVDNVYAYTNASHTATALALALSLKNVVIGHSIVVEGGALTLALHVPSVRLDSTYTTTAQALTATLNAPVIRGDANVSVVAQALTLLLNDPTYRSDVNWTATVQELVATLNDPTVVWDSTVSPSALTLTATLKDGTPFLITRIIRRDYTFGVTEQVTHTKLNNLADTAIWEISNQVAGDMFYYEGTDPDTWKRIPVGTNGQVLTINASGVPRWA